MRTVLISPVESERTAFEEAAAACGRRLRLSRVLDHYPEPETLSRVIRAWAPEMVVISMHDEVKPSLLCQHLQQEFDGIQVVGIHSAPGPDVFRRALHMRMREVIAPPFDPQHLVDLSEMIGEELSQRPVKFSSSDRLHAFLPAKPGVGTSTIAAHTTWALGRLPDSRVLLADFDLSSGIAGFLFNAEHNHSTLDAIQHGSQLDEDSWERLITRVGNIDLLLSDSPRIPELGSHRKVQDLIDFARRNYSIINADLSDSLDELSLSVLREANRIFLVTTPELPALRLAKLKTMIFRRSELEDKTVLLVNRLSKKSPLSVDEIQEAVGLPVFATFGSEYPDVMTASQNGCASPKLAPDIDAFVEKLTGDKPPAVKRQRFIERFSMMPSGYSYREAH